MKVNLNQIPDETALEETKPTAAPVEPETESKEPPKSLVQSVKDGSLFRRNKFWIILCVILFFVFILMNARISNEGTRLKILLNNATRETNHLISATDEVKQDLEEQARIESVKLTQEEEELARNNAIEQGVLVAKLQNEYSEFEPPESPGENASDEEKAAYKAELDAYTQTIRDNRNALKPYFGQNDKAGESTWYNYKEPLGISGTWEFASKASFKGNDASVLWLCRSEDGQLLAYTTAVYHADTKLFTDTKCLMTRYAQSHLTTDTKSDTSGEDSVISIADQVKDIADEIPNEELETETSGDLSETRTSYKEDVANGEVKGEDYDENYNVGLPKSDKTTEGGNEE